MISQYIFIIFTYFNTKRVMIRFWFISSLFTVLIFYLPRDIVILPHSKENTVPNKSAKMIVSGPLNNWFLVMAWDLVVLKLFQTYMVHIGPSFLQLTFTCKWIFQAHPLKLNTPLTPFPDKKKVWLFGTLHCKTHYLFKFIHSSDVIC